VIALKLITYTKRPHLPNSRRATLHAPTVPTDMNCLHPMQRSERSLHGRTCARRIEISGSVSRSGDSRSTLDGARPQAPNGAGRQGARSFRSAAVSDDERPRHQRRLTVASNSTVHCGMSLTGLRSNQGTKISWCRIDYCKIEHLSNPSLRKPLGFTPQENGQMQPAPEHDRR
jgi:hypothetical protein